MHVKTWLQYNWLKCAICTLIVPLQKKGTTGQCPLGAWNADVIFQIYWARTAKWSADSSLPREQFSDSARSMPVWACPFFEIFLVCSSVQGPISCNALVLNSFHETGSVGKGKGSFWRMVRKFHVQAELGLRMWMCTKMSRTALILQDCRWHNQKRYRTLSVASQHMPALLLVLWDCQLSQLFYLKDSMSLLGDHKVLAKCGKKPCHPIKISPNPAVVRVPSFVSIKHSFLWQTVPQSPRAWFSTDIQVIATQGQSCSAVALAHASASAAQRGALASTMDNMGSYMIISLSLCVYMYILLYYITLHYIILD